jgi:hypothetical protein
LFPLCHKLQQAGLNDWPPRMFLIPLKPNQNIHLSRFFLIMLTKLFREMTESAEIFK